MRVDHQTDEHAVTVTPTPTPNRIKLLRHQNGLLRFVARNGIAYMAITHFAHHEAVVLLDPYVYTKAEGGGEVVQRCAGWWELCQL